MKRNRTCLKILRYRKDHPFVFYFMVIYLGGIFIYILIFHVGFADYSKPMPLNEVGDFLAGVFAPLAFLFLYLGYKQQGNELKQNTIALERQATELENSVKEQKRLIELHEKEQIEKHFQVQPEFIIVKQDIIKVKEVVPELDDEGIVIGEDFEDNLKISFSLKNKGELAKNVLVRSLGNSHFIRFRKDKLNYEDTLNISWSYEGQMIEYLEEGGYYSDSLVLTYTNIYGKQYTKFINYYVSTYPDPEEGTHHFSLSLSMTD